MYVIFFSIFYRHCYHRDLHVLTHSCPTRLSSDLVPLDFTKRRSALKKIVAEFSCLVLLLSGILVAIVRMSLQGGQTLLGILYVRRQTLLFRKKMTIRSEEHTSELQSLMRISYAVFCLKKNN